MLKIYVQDFVFTGFPVSKKNRPIISESRKRSPSLDYRAWHAKALQELYSHYKPEEYPEPVNYPVRIKIIFRVKSLDKVRDGDNAETSILDLLKDARVILDDNLRIVRGVSWGAIEDPTREEATRVTLEPMQLESIF